MTTTYVVRRHTYRGREGWHIGSRGREGGWPISIFVTRREGAELIRDAYTAAERGNITADERDAYEGLAFDAERPQSMDGVGMGVIARSLGAY